MPTHALRASDRALRATIAGATLWWSAEWIAEITQFRTFQAAYLAPPIAALLVLMRPRVGAWLVITAFGYLSLDWLALALGLTVLAFRWAPSPARLAAAFRFAPAVVLCVGIPTFVWADEYTWFDRVAPLGIAMLAALWLLGAERRESGRVELTEGALNGLLAIVIVCALTGSITAGHGFEAGYASSYTCLGPHAGAYQRTECDVLLYGFAWSPWLALAAMLVASALFARRKTASLFVASIAVVSLLGECFGSFPGPGVMSCMHWEHAAVVYQLPMRALLAAAWLPWVGAIARFLATPSVVVRGCAGTTPGH